MRNAAAEFTPKYPNHDMLDRYAPEYGPYLENDVLRENSLFRYPHRQVVNDYIDTHPSKKYYRSTKLTFPSSRWLSRSELDPQVGIGVAHDLNDDSYMLIDTLRQIHASDIEKGKIEVHIGFNTAIRGQPNDDITEGVERYENLTDILATNQLALFPGVGIHTFLTHITDRTMNKVWNRLVEAIADTVIWEHRHRDATYPLIRLDSDSRSVTPEALPRMIDAIRGNYAHLIKLPTSFQDIGQPVPTGRYAPSDFLTQKERMAHAVTHLYAVTKDLIDVQLGATEHRTYDEESGSGARLIDWMRVLTCQRQEDPEGISTEGETRAFLRIAKAVLSKEVAPIYYLDRQAALHHTSHRRIFIQALRNPAWRVPLYEDGSDYLPYVNLPCSKDDFSEIQSQTREYAMAMVGILLLRQEKISGREISLPRDQQNQLAELVSDPLFQHGGQSLGMDWIAEAKRLGTVYLAG